MMLYSENILYTLLLFIVCCYNGNCVYRYASPMANSPVIGGSHSSSGSHIMDDVYITGSLSQIPVSPTASLHEWALDREDSQSPLPPLGDHIRNRSNTSPSPLHYTHIRTLSPHPPSVAITHRRSSPDPYCGTDSSIHINSSNDVIMESPAAANYNLDGNKSSSFTLLDCRPHNAIPSSANKKTSLQHRAASSPSLDHFGDHNEGLLQQPQPTSSSSCNHDISGRMTASNRRGIKLSLEDLTRIEPCRDVKKKSHEEQTLSNGDMLDTHVEKAQTLSPIEDGQSSTLHSQELLSLSENTSSEVSCQRSNKRSYSSQRERLHRSLSKPLTGASQSTSSQGSYSFDNSLSSDYVSGKSLSVTTDTSQVDYGSNTGSQEFSRQRANSFKKYLESSLHEAFPSLDDDEEESMALEVKTVQHSQDERVKAAKLSPGSDHVVNHLSCETTKGYSPGSSPMKPHRIIMHDDSASQPFQMERSRSVTIERVFSDGNFHEQRKQKSSGSIFAYKQVSCMF